MNSLPTLGAAAGLLFIGLAAAPPAAAKAKTAEKKCMADCRKARQACVKSGKSGSDCFAARRACYKKCRKAGAK